MIYLKEVGSIFKKVGMNRGKQVQILAVTSVLVPSQAICPLFSFFD